MFVRSKNRTEKIGKVLTAMMSDILIDAWLTHVSLTAYDIFTVTQMFHTSTWFTKTDVKGNVKERDRINALIIHSITKTSVKGKRSVPTVTWIYTHGELICKHAFKNAAVLGAQCLLHCLGKKPSGKWNAPRPDPLIRSNFTATSTTLSKIQLTLR